MKISLLALALFSPLAAQAAPLCGVINSHMVGPVCLPGRACPHFVRLVYDIRLDNGKTIDLSTADTAVLGEFADYRDSGKAVCVRGEMDSDGSYKVNAVAPRN